MVDKHSFFDEEVFFSDGRFYNAKKVQQRPLSLDEDTSRNSILFNVHLMLVAIGCDTFIWHLSPGVVNKVFFAFFSQVPLHLTKTRVAAASPVRASLQMRPRSPKRTSTNSIVCSMTAMTREMNALQSKWRNKYIYKSQQRIKWITNGYVIIMHHVTHHINYFHFNSIYF